VAESDFSEEVGSSPAAPVLTMLTLGPAWHFFSVAGLI